MARSFLSGEGAGLYVDMSDLEAKISLLRGVMKRENFERLMYRTFNEVGKKSKTMIAREVQKDYVVTQAWVRSQIEKYELSFGGFAPVTCKIPVSGHKGSIGGRFRVRGSGYNSGPHGTFGLRYPRRGFGPPQYVRMRGNGRIEARIVKSGASTMPHVMKNQGGNAPFLAKGVAYTRRTKNRLPIVRVVGLGVPQMPLNRSDTKVQDALLEYAGKRLEHNFEHMFGSGK